MGKALTYYKVVITEDYFRVLTQNCGIAVVL